jgi:hypothetical protein
MGLPGFSANSSLYYTATHYHLATVWRSGSNPANPRSAGRYLAQPPLPYGILASNLPDKKRTRRHEQLSSHSLPGFTADTSVRSTAAAGRVVPSRSSPILRSQVWRRSERPAAHPTFSLKQCDWLLCTACWEGAFVGWLRCKEGCDSKPPRIREGCYEQCTRDWEQIIDQICALSCCPTGTSCKYSTDNPPAQYCCAIGEVPCGGQCVSYGCELPYVFNDKTCQCDCAPTLCPPWEVLDPKSCTCVCPPCSGGKQPDRLCHCNCPSGSADCGSGVCCNLTSTDCCGDCQTQCQPNEACCVGENPPCRTLGTLTDCTMCGDACPLFDGNTEWDCCEEGCAPLNTIANCGACGNACTAEGMYCDDAVGCTCGPNKKNCNGVCTDVLDSDPNNCGDCGVQVGLGQACCDGVPTDLGSCSNCNFCRDKCGTKELCCNINGILTRTDVTIDTQNCGACGNDCNKWLGSGATCSNSQCVCPPKSTPCRSTCCGGNFPFCCDNCGPGNWCCGAGFPTSCPPTTGFPNGGCCAPNYTCCPPNSVKPTGYCCSPGLSCCDSGNGCC